MTKIVTNTGAILTVKDDEVAEQIKKHKVGWTDYEEKTQQQKRGGRNRNGGE